MGDSEKKTKAESFYEDLMTRYERKTVEYQAAWAHYKRMDLMIFTIPLIVAQVANTIMPQYMTDASTIKTVATTIAACSAAWIALRGKLNWDKKFAEYRNACKTYSSMVNQARNGMTKEALRRDEGSLDTAKAMASRKEFVENAADFEKQATAATAPVGFVLKAKSHLAASKHSITTIKSYANLATKARLLENPSRKDLPEEVIEKSTPKKDEPKKGK